MARRDDGRDRDCGFGVAPTRPGDRDLILRTLENVEGMSLSALQAGLGDDWPFESFREYLDAIETRENEINLAVLVGHTPIRTVVMGENAVKDVANEERDSCTSNSLHNGRCSPAKGNQ